MNKKYKDIHTGDKYGNWVVLDENDYEQKKNYKKYLCQCTCINQTIRYVDERNLKNGSSISCGKCLYKIIKTGDVFGSWTVLENETGYSKILCKCSCGVVKNVSKTNLLNGDSTNCGCVKRNNHFVKNQHSDIGEKIIVGNKYNKWTVLKQVKTDSYLCECSCFHHTQKIIPRSQLINDKRKGCKKCRLMKNHIGKTYGYLTIMSIDEKTTKEKGRIYVYAKCKCDNIRSYEQESITRGRIISCGCKKHEIDLSLLGKKFGYLTVNKLIGRSYKNEKTSQSYINWECICDCGKTTVVRQCNLISGKTVSCGCMNRSYGEYLIYNFLKKYHFDFKEQYRINECRDILPLPFDFAVFNNKLIGLIEFDGKQHFYPYTFGGINVDEAIQNFKTCVIHDNIKNEYCKQNRIKLLRISYEDLEDDNWIYALWDFLYNLNLIVDINSIT